MPKMIMQPVIENVFEHGLKNKLAGGILKIYFLAEGNSLDITVEDNGEELGDENSSNLQDSLSIKGEEVESTGLVNIHRRLILNHGAESGVQVYRSELGGLKLILHLDNVYDESIGELTS